MNAAVDPTRKLKGGVINHKMVYSEPQKSSVISALFDYIRQRLHAVSEMSQTL